MVQSLTFECEVNGYLYTFFFIEMSFVKDKIMIVYRISKWILTMPGNLRLEHHIFKEKEILQIYLFHWVKRSCLCSMHVSKSVEDSWIFMKLIKKWFDFITNNTNPTNRNLMCTSFFLLHFFFLKFPFHIIYAPTHCTFVALVELAVNGDKRFFQCIVNILGTFCREYFHEDHDSWCNLTELNHTQKFYTVIP